ncbi:MAG: DUF1805 domain-containing protein [Eubacterium sp.]|nr:DUF1805 domain-containing protein [Eubacterium sp.]
MVTLEEIKIGSHTAAGTLIKAPGGEGHPNIIEITCEKGFLMCGYINLAAAGKFGDAAVQVGGADFDAVLKNPIKGMTPAAEKLGVQMGMTGYEAAEKLF